MRSSLGGALKRSSGDGLVQLFANQLVLLVSRLLVLRQQRELIKAHWQGPLPADIQLLRDAELAPKSASKQSSSGNPAVLYAALGCSLLASVVLLVVDIETSSSVRGKAEARQAIAAEFLGREGQPLKPYQRALREASLAHSRGDVPAEHAAYRRVLQILNSEDRNPFTGVTGE